MKPFGSKFSVAWLALTPLVVVPMVGCGGGSPPDAATSTVSDTTTESTLEAGQGTSATFEPSNVEIPAGGLSLPEGDVPVETPESKAPVDGGMKLPDEFDPTQSSVETQGDGALVASRSPVGTPVELTKVRYAEWASIASLGSTNGRVTVIDYWSLACGPCLKEYPNLVGLAAKYPEKVQAIGVNLDYDGRKSRPPETYEAAVLDFLNAVSADFPNYIAQTPSDDIFRALDIASIPAVMVYSAKGELVGRFVDAGDTKGFTYAKDVLPLVERLLEAS